jgi:hypothetical protein
MLQGDPLQISLADCWRSKPARSQQTTITPPREVINVFGGTQAEMLRRAKANLAVANCNLREAKRRQVTDPGASKNLKDMQLALSDAQRAVDLAQQAYDGSMVKYGCRAG